MTSDDDVKTCTLHIQHSEYFISNWDDDDDNSIIIIIIRYLGLTTSWRLDPQWDIF